jgi:hypothetical protein
VQCLRVRVRVGVMVRARVRVKVRVRVRLLTPNTLRQEESPSNRFEIPLSERQIKC